jgi:hypothetical protein
VWSRLRQALAEEAGMPAVLDKAGEHSFVAAFEERPVVVDLGANRGGFAREVLARFPSARLVLVEANPLLAEDLRRAFADLPNARPAPAQHAYDPRKPSIEQTVGVRRAVHVGRAPAIASVARAFQARHGRPHARTKRRIDEIVKLDRDLIDPVQLRPEVLEDVELGALDVDLEEVDAAHFALPCERPNGRHAHGHGPALVQVAAAMRLPWQLAVRIVRRISGAPDLKARGSVPDGNND